MVDDPGDAHVVGERRHDTVSDRIFVEWHDPDRPDWGGWVSSASPEFQAELAAFVARCGPPTLVEFRAAGEGYAAPTPCEDCGKPFAQCRCDGYDPDPPKEPQLLDQLHDYYYRRPRAVR